MAWESFLKSMECSTVRGPWEGTWKHRLLVCVCVCMSPSIATPPEEGTLPKHLPTPTRAPACSGFH